MESVRGRTESLAVVLSPDLFVKSLPVARGGIQRVAFPPDPEDDPPLSSEGGEKCAPHSEEASPTTEESVYDNFNVPYPDAPTNSPAPPNASVIGHVPGKDVVVGPVSMWKNPATALKRFTNSPYRPRDNRGRMSGEAYDAYWDDYIKRKRAKRRSSDDDDPDGTLD
jgi:hypothetical protein